MRRVSTVVAIFWQLLPLETDRPSSRCRTSDGAGFSGARPFPVSNFVAAHAERLRRKVASQAHGGAFVELQSKSALEAAANLDEIEA